MVSSYVSEQLLFETFFHISIIVFERKLALFKMGHPIYVSICSFIFNIMLTFYSFTYFIYYELLIVYLENC